jgi:hypothetical protein
VASRLSVSRDTVTGVPSIRGSALTSARYGKRVNEVRQRVWR